jgi:hypothetical protein
VHVRCCAVELGGFTHEPGPSHDAGRQYHGQQALHECVAFWNMHEHCQSDGGCCDCRSAWSFDTYALYSYDHGSMGARKSKSIVGQHANFKQFVEIDVQLGRGNQYFKPRSGKGSGLSTLKLEEKR